MAGGQQWLFAPTRPLVERLGEKFFRKLPARPGVYFMRNSAGAVIYVGSPSQLPHGWAQGRFALPVTISCGAREAEIRLALENLFWGRLEGFSLWLQASIEPDLAAFERATVLAELEELETFFAGEPERMAGCKQLALL